MPPITFNGNTLEPDTSRSRLAPDASQTDYILIQTDHLLSRDESLSLIAKGVEILQLATTSIDKTVFTYLCHYPHTDLATLNGLPFVLHALTYHDDFVVAPTLKQADWDSDHPGPGIVMSKRGEDGDGDGERRVGLLISLHTGCSQDTANNVRATIEMMAEPGQESVEILHCSPSQLGILAMPALIPKIAALDPVMAVNPARQNVMHTLKIRDELGCPTSEFFPAKSSSSPSQFSYTGAGPRYQGQNQIVGVMDSGFDLGDYSNPDAIHPGALLTSTPKVEHRIANLSDHSNRTPKRANGIFLADAIGHGTHVAGIISSGLDRPTAAPAFPKSSGCIGVAPESKIYMTPLVIGHDDDRAGNIRRNIQELKDQTFNVTILNNSWGVDPPKKGESGSYIATAADEIDVELFNDIQLLTPFSAGNEARKLAFHDQQAKTKPVNRQINAQAQGKNVITVGATWNDRFYAPRVSFLEPQDQVAPFEDGNTEEGRAYDNLDIDFTVNDLSMGKEPAKSIATFSNKGPTYHNLLKPDVVAPGTGVLSLLSRHPAAYGNFHHGPKEKNTFPDGTDLMFAAGTSMSAPVVSALAACIKEAAIVTSGYTPTGITLKAIIINAAVSCAGAAFFYMVFVGNKAEENIFGRGVLQNPPDCIQGFGEVNYPRSIAHFIPTDLPPLLQPPNYAGYVEFLFDTASNATFERDIVPRETDTKCSVTLAWYDPPAAEIQFKLQLQVQVTNPAGSVTQHSPPPIFIYPDYPIFTSGTAPSVDYGCVQKVTIDLTPGLGQQVKARVTSAAGTVFANRTANFSVVWLCE